MGNVVSAGLGQNIARQCAIRGGVPESVGASTINKVCGASLKTVMLAAQAIRAGDGDLFVCGGVESMSRAPHLIDGRAQSAALRPLHPPRRAHRRRPLVCVRGLVDGTRGRVHR